MFTEDVIIDTQFASNDDQCDAHVVNTKALLHTLFERSKLVGDHYEAIVQAQSANNWEGYGALKADIGKSTIDKLSKDRPSELIDGMRTSKQLTNLLDGIFVNNILRAIDDLRTGLDNNDVICNHMRKHFGFSSDDKISRVQPTFTAKIQDKNMTVKLPKATWLRPSQERITVEDPAPLSGIGAGWASKEGECWFESNPKD